MSPVQVAKSKLAAKYGANLGKSAMSHAKDETTAGVQGVPPGIRDGIARLTSVKFDAYKTGNNAGKFYFQCQGMAITPDSIPGPQGILKVRGRNTRVQIAIDEQKDGSGKVTATQDEQVAKIVNQMRLLAGDEFADQILKDNAPAAIQNDPNKLGLWAAEMLESMAAQLNESCESDDTAIHFYFSTSERAAREYIDPKTKQKKTSQAGVWENWGEACAAPDQASQVDDDSGASKAPSSNGTPTPADETPSDDATSPDETPSLTPEEIEALDLPTLAEVASSETPDAELAGERLSALALEAGVSEDEIKAAESWVAIVELIEAKAAEAEAAASTPEPEWEPSVKQVYKYQVLDAKGKPVINPKTKKSANPIEVRVEAVDKAKKTVKLKNLEDGKTPYLNQSWDRLIRE